MQRFANVSAGLAPGLREAGPALLRQFSPAVLGTTQMVPVVVEFQQPPTVVYHLRNPLSTKADVDAYTEELSRNHTQFVTQLHSLGMDVRVSSTGVIVAEPNNLTTEDVAHDFTYLFNGVGLLLPGRMVQQIAAMTGVRAITYNAERVYLNLDNSVPFTGAPEVWKQIGPGGIAIMGQGVQVAIIDTGVLVFKTQPLVA